MANQEKNKEAKEVHDSPESGSLDSNVFGASQSFYESTAPAPRSITSRLFDGFKRDPNLRATPHGIIGSNGKVFDVEAANEATANSPLARKLKGRHLQMIAIGGSIGACQGRFYSKWKTRKTDRSTGTGLFVASGKALSTGGPASLLIAYALIGVMLYCTVQALGEMAVCLPVAGSFSAYSTRFLDPAWGFAMGWNYALQWLVVLPLEVVAASITVGYWNDRISAAAWVTLFLVAIISINLFGVKGYGEAEFVFSIVKVIAVIGFMCAKDLLFSSFRTQANASIESLASH